MFILIANTKGGVGKTILSTSILAELSKNSDVAVIGIDLDSANKSASNEWTAKRPDEEQGRFYYLSGNIDKDLEKVKNGYDHCVIDCGGFDNEEFRRAIMYADVVVIPVLVGSESNIKGMQKVAEVIEQIRPNNLPKVIGVATKSPNLGTNAELDRAINAIIEDPLVEPCSTALGDRVWYGRAYDEGKGITELKGLNNREQKLIDSASSEFMVLFNDIFKG